MRYFLLFVIVIFIIMIFVMFQLDKYEVVYHMSSVDGEEYLVRDLPDKENAANLLAEIKSNIFTISDYLHRSKNSYPRFEPYISQMWENLKFTVINESSSSGSYTSYSVNKGEQIVFCLRSKYTNKLHDINLLMYVVVHELAHVACPEYGHTNLFLEIFSFLLHHAIKLKLYKKIDFNSYPSEYCGLIISESII